MIVASAAAAETPCPPHDLGTYPWSRDHGLMPGDLWAWVYLDLDKHGHPERCYIGETNISGPETRSDLCRSFVDGWHGKPLMENGKPVAGLTKRWVGDHGK